MNRGRVVRAVSAACLLLTGASACNDDEPVAVSETTTTEGAGGDVEAWCAVVAGLDDTNPSAGFEGATTAAEAETAYDDGLAALQPLVDEAPVGIAAAAADYVGAFERFGDLTVASLSGGDLDMDALLAVQADVEAAQADIEAVAAETC